MLKKSMFNHGFETDGRNVLIGGVEFEDLPVKNAAD